MPPVIISLKNVTIRYPDLSSFAHINIDVEQGKHLALVGNNEPLKSALMDALAGNVPVINGSKTYPVAEQDIHTKTGTTKKHHRLVASVSSRHGFKNLSNTSDFYYQQRFNSCDSENSLTVEQYLNTLPVDEENKSLLISEIVDLLKLHSLLNEGVIKLSNGETRRVLIAAALVQQPLLLLLHNPLTGLDKRSRTEVIALINDVANNGTTVVMTAQPGEIPNAIRTIVEVNEQEPLSFTPVKDYKPDQQVQSVAIVDEQLVKQLCSRKQPASFDLIVSMKDVCIHYDGKAILDGINWTILQGECWALQGANGAGKSTLLSLVTGDNPQAFANDIILFDRKKGSGESIWEIKQKIGFFSPELYQYFPGDTLAMHAVESGFYDTIGLFRPSHNTTSAIALQWMKILGVDVHANKLLRNLSAVDQRLCLLARAMVKNPVLLILDEPCQGFTTNQKEYFKALVNSVCRNSLTTLIYVSHYTDEIPSCVTKYFRLHQGKQVEEY